MKHLLVKLNDQYLNADESPEDWVRDGVGGMCEAVADVSHLVGGEGEMSDWNAESDAVFPEWK